MRDILHYDVHVSRDFMGRLTAPPLDVMPATVEISVTFNQGRDAESFRQQVIDMLMSDG